MEEILTQVRNPAWWFNMVFATVAVSLVVRIVARQVEPRWDAWIQGRIESRRFGRQRKLERRGDLVAILRDDPQKRIRWAIGQMKWELQAYLWAVLAAASYLAGMASRAGFGIMALGFFVMMTLAVLAAFAAHTAAWWARGILMDAEAGEPTPENLGEPARTETP